MFAGSKISRGCLYLFGVTTAVSLIYMLATDEIQAEIVAYVPATADTLWRRFEAWRLLTSPLLEPQLIALLFQGLMLWMFLPSLERWWGMKRFLLFALYTSVAGVVGGTLVGLALGGEHAATPVTGLDPFIFGAILAFGVLYATHQVRFFGAIPMTGKQLAIGITAVTAVLLILGQRWVEGGANASAMLLAFAMTSTRSSPKLWWLKWQQRRARRRLSVLEGGKRSSRDRYLN